MSDWQAVIGLEIHVQLSTQSKLFSGASTAYGAEPNTQASFVDVALPGTLPVPNVDAIRKAAMFGLAVGADVAAESIFARKNYFYPDSPKGYQISQYERPIVAGGTVLARLDDGREITVQLTRAHLEEDAGKSVHDAFHAASGIDLNRAGTPLIEVVSEPVMHSSAEAVAYMKAVHRLVRWLGICDGNLQEGSFRCDANVSVHKPGTPFGTRCEIKNVNSFRFVEKAIDYEIERQIRAIENGETIVQETRLYDAAANKTRTMRSKEDAEDRRHVLAAPDAAHRRRISEFRMAGQQHDGAKADQEGQNVEIVDETGGEEDRLARFRGVRHGEEPHQDMGQAGGAEHQRQAQRDRFNRAGHQDAGPHERVFLGVDFSRLAE